MKIILVFTKIGTLSLVFLLCLLCLQSDGADIGDDCTVNGNCTYDNGTCVDPICGCVATHYIHVDGDKVCQLKVILNNVCITGQPSDQCSDVQAECVTDSGTLKCLCKDGYYANSGSVCTQKVILNNVCITGQPSDQCSDVQAECVTDSGTLKCLCKDGYYANSGSVCTQKVILNNVCITGQPSDQCSDVQAECVTDSGTLKCLCKDGYYANSGSVCTQKVILNNVCITGQPSDQCSDVQAECVTDSGTLKCLCKDGYYANSGSVCTQKVILNNVCITGQPSDQCSDVQAECVTDSGTLKCLCKDGYYANSGSVCTQKVILNNVCITGQPSDQCSDVQAECVTDSGTLKCLCKDGYYANSGSVCTQKVILNNVCITGQPSDQCSDVRAECVTDSGTLKCLCKDGYYANSGSVCTQKVILNNVCITGQPSDQCSDVRAECVTDSGTLKCLCKDGYYANSGSVCTQKVILNNVCITGQPSDQCSDVRAECVTDSGTLKCLCKDGYYANSGSVCTQKVILNNVCITGQPSDQCSDVRAECVTDSGTLKCLCKDGYYANSGSVCTQKVILNNVCITGQPSDQCSDVRAECVIDSGTLKCLCKDGYYGNSGSVCTQKVILNNVCITGQPSDQCSDVRAECVTDSGTLKCLCKDGYYANSGSVCTQKIILNNVCITGQPSDQCSDVQAECVTDSGTLKCLCKDGYYANSGSVCTQKVILNNVCITGQPSYQCSDVRAECVTDSGTLKCLCKDGYYANSGSVCTQKIILNNVCITGQPSDQCSDVQAECVTDSGTLKCLCKDGYYANSGSVCTQKVILNNVCITGQPSDQCSDVRAECVTDSGTLKCLCKDGYYANSGSVCTQKVILNNVCITGQPSDQCSDVQAECVTDSGTLKCLCKDGYYANSGSVCTQKVILNNVCITGQPSDQCSDVRAECVTDSGTLKCLCKDGYYANSGSVCTQKVILNNVCITGQPSDQCSDVRAECVTDSGTLKCLCKDGYYANSGSVCTQMTGLKVQNLDVPDVTTGETFFVVKWTKPSTVSFIDKYQLILAFNNQSENPVDINKTNTNYNITDRVPGRTYTIILRSVETQSRPTPQTIDVIITDGTRPAIPGAIIQSVFNGPTINISWTITGDLEYLSGTISDTTASPSTFNLTFASQLPLLSVTDLRHGDHYTFTVISHSNGFSSVDYTQTIRTTPTRPPPPTVFACIDNNIFDRSMKLTWKEPATPNGYIQNYIIYDMTRNKNITTNGSVLEQTIDGLTPEWYYNFSITTVNDATSGESSNSTQITCRAKAGLSTPPQNFVATAVTSNKITVQWNYPIDPAGVLWGYRIHVKTDDTCVQEIIFQCVGDCAGVENLGYAYNCTMNITLDTDSTQMNQTMIYSIDDLLPYVNYEVTIQAVNTAGNGNTADISRTTSQEVPKKPLEVTGVAQSDPKTLQVTWQQPLPRPGITNYTVKVYEENDDATEFDHKEGLKKEISGYYNQTSTITGLEEYWNYKFVIVATTSRGSNESNMSTVVRTRHSAPGKVDNFTIENPSEIYNEMNVMWSIPPIRERNSVIMKYVISHNISGDMESLNVTASSDSFMETFNVTAEQWYEVEVYAVNTQNQMGNKSNEIYYAKPGPPKTPSVDAVIESTSDPATTQTTIKLKFQSSWFLNTDSGMRTDGGVMVCQESKCTEYGKSSQQKFVSHFRDITWKKSKTGGFEKPYRVTNSSWVDDISTTSGRRKRSTNEVELIIGEDVSCDKKDDNIFCNGPLPAGTGFIVVAFVCTNGGCTESQHFGPYYTQVLDGPPIGIIAGAVAAVVVVIIVVIIAVFVMRRRNRQKPKEKEWDDNPMGLQTPSVERKNIQINKPIVMEDFERAVEDFHKDANLKFAHEYEELKTLTDPKTLGVNTYLAETEENKLKNRYVNILPYDKTIVKLLPLADDDENATTFINANYIPGYRSQREYIASQGPIPSTIDDFWRMIWEQSVAIVVMLTLCKEQGRIKCECYWPTELRDPKQYREIVVELTSCSTLNTYEIRVFKLTMGNTTRYVKHFHFLNWKDFSANVQNDVMIDFIQNVRSHVRIPESKVPMIVHCSAGVGRTGTYIALDHLMQFINDHDFSKSIDIFNIVVKMRQCRMYMVQTEQQYIFIYDCIRDILEKKRLREQQTNEENLYENPNVKEEDLYDNNDFIYENKAFVPEPEPDLYQNVNDLQSTEERSFL